VTEINFSLFLYWQITSGIHFQANNQSNKTAEIPELYSVSLLYTIRFTRFY